MARITDHECVENDKGELALLLRPLGGEVTIEPTFLITRAEAKARLDIGDEESHEIVGLHPDVLDKLCAAATLLVIEMKSSEVLRTYNASIGVLEQSGDSET